LCGARADHRRARQPGFSAGVPPAPPHQPEAALPQLQPVPESLPDRGGRPAPAGPPGGASAHFFHCTGRGLHLPVFLQQGFQGTAWSDALCLSQSRAVLRAGTSASDVSSGRHGPLRMPCRIMVSSIPLSTVMAATSKSDMLESRRRAYLDALGIPLYHPRQQLPGALPSARLSSVPPARAAEVAAPASAALSPASPRPADGPVPGPSRAAAQETLQKAPLQGAATETSPSRAAQAVLAQSPTTAASRAEGPEDTPAEVGDSSSAQEEAVAFTFAFVPVSEQIAVINELPTAGAPALTPGSRQLLARILTALTLPVQERNLSSQSFVWPSPDLPVTEQGAAPARELLKG